MRQRLFLVPHLRSATFSRWLQRELISRPSIRLKSSLKPPRAARETISTTKPPSTIPQAQRQAVPATSKSKLRRVAPDQILIYHGGTGKTIFLGVMRITTIFVFGVSCLVVAPAFFAEEFPPWLAPAVVVGGALPLLFVGYTAAPFVNYIHLALPAFARKSREHALQYAKDLPSYATLYINTMKFSTIPRRIEVRLSDLVPDKSKLRPVSFRNINPIRLPWWQGRTQTQFFTKEKSSPGRPTIGFYPELWETVYKRIQQNQPPKSAGTGTKNQKS